MHLNQAYSLVAQKIQFAHKFNEYNLNIVHIY